MPLHKFLFFLLLLLLPTQLGKHFWPDFSFVAGLRVDYLSPTLYLTDILLLLLMITWLLPKLNKLLRRKIFISLSQGRRLVIPVFSLLLFSILNILLAKNQAVAFFKFLKLSELFFLAFYIAKSKPDFRLSLACLLLSVVWSSIIAWAQFIKQASLGGVFWLLGERSFNINTPGIAKISSQFSIFNFQFSIFRLRPYATFPHPNALAGYLTTLLPFLLLPLYKKEGSKQKLKQLRNTKLPVSSPSGMKRGYLPSLSSKFFSKLDPQNTAGMLICNFLLLLSLSTIFLSFSRTAWAVTLLLLLSIFPTTATQHLIIYYRSKRMTYLGGDRILSKPLFFISSLILALFLLSPFFLPRLKTLISSSQSFKLRQELAQTAFLMIKDHPLIGVGLNNFLVELPKYKTIQTSQALQPVHNIYLLIAAETGLVGGGIFLLLILKAYQQLISKSEKKINLSALIDLINLNKSQTLKKKLGIGLLDIGDYLDQLEIRSMRNFPLLLSLTSILLLSLFDHYFGTLQQSQLLFAIILGFAFAGRNP